MPSIVYTEKGGWRPEPETLYHWRAEKVTEDKAQTGTEFFDIRCVEKESGGKWGLSIYFTEKNYPNVCRFLRAIGIVAAEGENLNVTPEMVEGREFMAEVEEEAWDNGEKSGVALKFNNFSFAPIAGAKSSPSPAPKSSPAKTETAEEAGSW